MKYQVAKILIFSFMQTFAEIISNVFAYIYLSNAESNTIIDMKHMIPYLLRMVLPAVLLVLPAVGTEAQVSFTMRPVDFSQVKVNDPFWTPILDRVANTTLDVCIDQCAVKTHRIDNFAVAAGLKEGKFEGIFFDDSDVYKMLEGIAYSLVNHPDKALEARADSIINLIVASQHDDGYLNSYYTLVTPEKKWTDMDKHEMYCAGHMIEGAIAYYHATGKDKFLNTARRFADYLCLNFGKGKRNWVPGHEEIELALVKLYHETGEVKYLDLAETLIDRRGHGYGTWKHPEYYQDIVPVSELSEITGHAVRAMYLFSGMADVAVLRGRKDYTQALDRLWNDVILRKMYITGGIGSSKHNEGFTVPYDLPNKEAYAETCASIGMALWNTRMNRLHGDGKYFDVAERSIYNGTLSGISYTGDHFFYVNPLESAGDHHRQEWFGCACCPSNLDRFLPSVGGYAYAVSDNALWVNMYMGSSAKVSLGGGEVGVNVETRYPWEGAVKLTLNPSKARDFEVRLRIPGWCKDWSYVTSAKISGARVEKGYLVLRGRWKKGDTVTLDMDMPVEVVEADPRVEADKGLRAIQRGPIVYCLEEVDNPDIAAASLSGATTFTTAYDPSFLGGATLITARGTDGRELRFIPYFDWDNRTPGRMIVWVPWK